MATDLLLYLQQVSFCVRLASPRSMENLSPYNDRMELASLGPQGDTAILKHCLIVLPQLQKGRNQGKAPGVESYRPSVYLGDIFDI